MMMVDSHVDVNGLTVIFFMFWFSSSCSIGNETCIFDVICCGHRPTFTISVLESQSYIFLDIHIYIFFVCVRVCLFADALRLSGDFP